MIVLVIIVIVLVFTVLMLGIYNLSLYKKIQSFQDQKKRTTSLHILQDFMNITGTDLSVEKKIKSINDVIIDKYEIKYSTIVIYDGTSFVVKASNVTQNHWNALSRLHELDVFIDSIQKGIPKYLTVNNDNERLVYQDNEFARAKSAIFFPLFIDNIFIGYWIIESGTPHEFDNIDTDIFEIVKNNIVSVLRAVDYQKTLENLVRKDLFTGLNSAEYLYGEGKKIIDQHETSAICMFRISNIEDINRISRELGNKVITQTSKNIQENIADKYIFVRYMGPKFVVVFLGVKTQNVGDFITQMKESAESLKISLKENFQTEELGNKAVSKKRKKIEEIEVSPSLNFVVATYYKGTGIEEVLQKLEKYLDEASKNESQISNI